MALWFLLPLIRNISKAGLTMSDRDEGTEPPTSDFQCRLMYQCVWEKRDWTSQTNLPSQKFWQLLKFWTVHHSWIFVNYVKANQKRHHIFLVEISNILPEFFKIMVSDTKEFWILNQLFLHLVFQWQISLPHPGQKCVSGTFFWLI